LPWDSIEPIPFTPWDDKQFDFEQLRQLSKKRCDNDEGMRTIAEEAIRAAERAEHSAIDIGLAEMRLQREEAEVVREKIGAHYRKYREEQDDDGNYPEDEDDKGDPREVWLKNVKEDPYVREAVNIVADISRLPRL